MVMASFTPNTSPYVLEWARKVNRLPRDVAAKRIGVDPIVIDFWEHGAESPTMAQLRAMAKAYRKPLAVLLRRSLPPGEEPITMDYRLLPQNQGKEWSPELRQALWRVEYQRDIVLDLARQDDTLPRPLDFALSLNEVPEEVGGRVHSWLGVPSAPVDFDRPRAHLDRWIDAVEAQFILVVEIGRVRLEEMRGCSISDQPFPLIVLNGKDTPSGKLFTLLHELTHILLHAGGLCDLETKRIPVTNDRVRIERFCNEVAAATLMPRLLVLRHPLAREASSWTYWDDRDLLALALSFGVSREAMLLRLISLDRASREQYDELKPHYEEVYAERLEERQKRQKSRGFNYYRAKIREFGRRYISSVIDAYDRDAITSVELADYLDMRTKYIPNLREALGEGG